MSTARRRLTPALLLSLLIHALLLSLTFGGQGLGLPGFGLPWQERRIEAPDLRIVLMPAPVTAAKPPGAAIQQPSPQASMAPPVDGGPAPVPALSAALIPTPAPPAPAPAPAPAPEAIEPAAKPAPHTVAAPAPAPEAEAEAERGAATVPSPTDGPGDVAPASMPKPAVIAMASTDEATPVVPAVPSMATPVTAAAPGASRPERVMPTPRRASDAAPAQAALDKRARADALAEIDRSAQEAQRLAARQAAARQEAASQAAARRTAEQVETLGLRAEREEATRLAADRQEAARRDAERVERERLQAERDEAARQAAARQEALRQEATRRDADRVERERRQAESDEVARQTADRQAAARLQAAQEAAARREAALRAIGRQLDEEAARRDAAAKAASLTSGATPSSSGARRGRLFGRTDPNVELILYAEAWARKIQLNMTFDMVRDAAKRPHTDPLVTVALRSDGSVESVSFVRSSGVADLDEAIRRIVQSQMPYPAFPPGLAREFDVIEIRRTWHFDMAIRLY